MSTIYIKVENGVITDHMNVDNAHTSPEGWIEAIDTYDIGWSWDGNIATAPADTRTYSEKRADEYPSIGDQLDMIYHAGQGGDEFQAAIKAVKDKYPKE